MNINNVPQDKISTYSNNKKAMYALNEKGEYEIISSSGWDVEEEATIQALQELKRLAREAYEEVQRGEKSPLYYHMFEQRMELLVLSQAIGMFQWRVKRHFKPSVFKKLSSSMLEKYSEALGLSVTDLQKLPARENDE